MEGHDESYEYVQNHGSPKLSQALAILDSERLEMCYDILNVGQQLPESSQT